MNQKRHDPTNTDRITSAPVFNLSCSAAALWRSSHLQPYQKGDLAQPSIRSEFRNESRRRPRPGQKSNMRTDDRSIWIPLILGLVSAFGAWLAYALPDGPRFIQNTPSDSAARNFAQANTPSSPTAAQSQTPHSPPENGSAFGKILSAKSVFLMAYGPSQESKTPGLIGERLASQSLALRTLTEAVRKWGRFAVVDDHAEADLVLVIVEWNELTKWGKNLQCHDRLLVFPGGTVPTRDSQPLWQIEDGQWGGCSAAARPLKDLRKELEQAEKHSRRD